MGWSAPAWTALRKELHRESLLRVLLPSAQPQFSGPRLPTDETRTDGSGRPPAGAAGDCRVGPSAHLCRARLGSSCLPQSSAEAVIIETHFAFFHQQVLRRELLHC